MEPTPAPVGVPACPPEYFCQWTATPNFPANHFYTTQVFEVIAVAVAVVAAIAIICWFTLEFHRR